MNASDLQTIGTIRANAAQRETDISQLEAASHSPDPAQHTEMATLQRINQALLIELRTQQETNQMLQAQRYSRWSAKKSNRITSSLCFSWQWLPAELQRHHAAADDAGTQWAFHY